MLVGIVILGGIRRIAHTAEAIVPIMCLIYLLACLVVIVCTMTALVVILSGTMETGFTGAERISNAFDTILPRVGGLVVLVRLLLFAYTTMLTWSFYGEKCLAYIFGKRIVTPYRGLFIVFLYIRTIGGLTLSEKFGCITRIDNCL